MKEVGRTGGDISMGGVGVVGVLAQNCTVEPCWGR